MQEPFENLVHVKIDHLTLEGMLAIPENAHGLVIFAHGSGSSRLSPRNNFVADILQQGGIATLLIDLLSEKEDRVYENRFNIDLLTERLLQIIQWLKTQREAKGLPIGLFGASTGAASALKIAAALPQEIKAVVSRGGRPDLALDVVTKVIAPTLLIVGGNDFGVIELNQEVYDALSSIKKLEIVKGATHLFEEPECLEQVAKLSQEWFKKYLSKNTKK